MSEFELILTEGERHQRYRFDALPIRIGRGDAADIRVSCDRASRAHAIIEYGAGRPVLRDLGSSNGTLVNGERVSEHALNRGDRIEIGEAEITWLVGPSRQEPLRMASEDERGTMIPVRSAAPPYEPDAEDEAPVRRIDKSSRRWKIMNRSLAAAIFIILNGSFALFWHSCVVGGLDEERAQADAALESRRVEEREAAAKADWMAASKQVDQHLVSGQREAAYLLVRNQIDRWPEAAASSAAKALKLSLEQSFEAEADGALALMTRALDEGRTADARRLFEEKGALLRRWRPAGARDIEQRLSER